MLGGYARLEVDVFNHIQQTLNGIGGLKRTAQLKNGTQPGFSSSANAGPKLRIMS